MDWYEALIIAFGLGVAGAFINEAINNLAKVIYAWLNDVKVEEK